MKGQAIILQSPMQVPRSPRFSERKLIKADNVLGVMTLLNEFDQLL